MEKSGELQVLVIRNEVQMKLTKQKTIIIVFIIVLLIIIIGISLILFSNGSAIYSSKDECTKKDKICSNEQIAQGVIVKVKVNSKKEIPFYLIENNEYQMTLISKEVLKENTNWSQYDDNIYGPDTLMLNLYEITKDWTNIPKIIEYKYEDEGFEDYVKACLIDKKDSYEFDCANLDYFVGYSELSIKDGILSLTSADRTDTTYDAKEYRAKIWSKKEIMEFETRLADYSISWLKDTKSFWTITSATKKIDGSYTSAYAVEADDNKKGFQLVAKTIFNSSTETGIRPIITIDKIK